MIRTKIVSTLGPASSSEEMIGALIDRGVDVFRLNFSHGTLEQHAKLLETINRVRDRHERAVAVMGDLCGPKIRTSDIEPDGELLVSGDRVVIQPGIKVGTAHHFGTNFQGFCQDVQLGHRVMIDDGQIVGRVIEKDETRAICRIEVGGPLHSHKGINLPDTDVSIPSITERDWECTDWAIEHQLDFLALSFVRSADELNQLRAHIRAAGADIKLVSKIEKPQAIDRLQSIVEASDVVLVARGDLGVEMDLAHVPLIQKRITHMCRQLGKPVIVATQMLQSMVDAPVPTRAEVSDVANAILDLTDAVMLSGETAVGKYPMETIATINRIAGATEEYLDSHQTLRRREKVREDIPMSVALVNATAQLFDETDAKLVAALSSTGATVRLLSKARFDALIIAFTPDLRTCREMCMYYGVIPFCRPAPNDMKDWVEMTDSVIRKNGWAKGGDQIIMLAGQPITPAGTTNALMVRVLSE